MMTLTFALMIFMLVLELQSVTISHASTTIKMSGTSDFDDERRVIQDLFSRGRSGLVHSEDQPCPLSLSALTMLREIENSGFHRTMVTNISLDVNPGCQECRVMLLQYLPKGLFIDTHQMRSLAEFGGPQVMTFEKIDTEKPAHQSEGHLITVYSPDSYSETDHVTVSLHVPIHVRYHMASRDHQTWQVAVSLPHPHTYLHCKGCTQNSCSGDAKADMLQAPCTASNHSMCSWTPLPHTKESVDTLELHVPIGQDWLSVPVTIATLVCIMAGSLAILITMVTEDDKNMKKMKER
ncbi:phosphatidylinositol-glycan biosynthesis class X protein-like [Diadema setosum]|uniref:phosphatidylinositol-glycan biosynthesis class X protein-like n=1 Tax=Diadema setosum TaxID=31175 RepID=UPI003B3B2D6F